MQAVLGACAVHAGRVLGRAEVPDNQIGQGGLQPGRVLATVRQSIAEYAHHLVAEQPQQEAGLLAGLILFHVGVRALSLLPGHFSFGGDQEQALDDTGDVLEVEQIVWLGGCGSEDGAHRRVHLGQGIDHGGGDLDWVADHVGRELLEPVLHRRGEHALDEAGLGAGQVHAYQATEQGLLEGEKVRRLVRVGAGEKEACVGHGREGIGVGRVETVGVD